MPGSGGQERLPGELRRSPVWVGLPTDAPENAVFVHRVERVLGMTDQDARNLVHQAVDRGWVERFATLGGGGRTFWVGGRILEVIEAPPPYRRTG